MPRRRALTEAQLESLLALPTTEADLVRHWTLDRADLAAVDRRRGGHNQFGFALQLCALRYPGRLPRSGELIPAEALRFVATQLGAEPEALASYAARFQPRYEQLDALRRCSASPSWACPNGARSWLGCCQWRWPPRVPPPLHRPSWRSCADGESSCPAHSSSSASSRSHWCWPNGTLPTSSPVA